MSKEHKSLLSRSAKNFKFFLKRTAAFCLKSAFGKHSFPFFGLAQGIEKCSDWSHLVLPLESSLSLVTPKTVEERLFWKFKDAVSKPEVKDSPSLIFIPDATATRRGAHLTKEGKLITQFFQPLDGKSFKQDALFFLSAKQFFPKILSFNEPVVAITSGWQGAFYHWMYEVLPRLLLVEESGLPIKKLYIEAQWPFQKQTLELLSYGPDVIVNAAEYDAVKTNQLIIPSCSGLSGSPSKWACEFLRRRFLPHISKTTDFPDKIFISRSKARWRRITNEEEVRSFLEKKGFVTVFLEQLSLLEQMSLFYHAKKIVAPHGAGLSHVIFCQKGTFLLELFSPSYVLPCYWRIGHAAGIDYHYMLGEGKIYPDGHDPHEDPDITIDLSKLAKACSF